jgi:endonuclease III-like uncharacterized protein
MTSQPFSLVKPTPSTPFHIDFDWWKEHDNNWRIFLFSCLCQDHQETYRDQSLSNMIDWVDPITAEIRMVDGLQATLIEHCAKEANFYTQNTTLVDSIFRVFLANGNNPMSSIELSDKIVILRTIGGFTVYKGIRPCH